MRLWIADKLTWMAELLVNLSEWIYPEDCECDDCAPGETYARIGDGLYLLNLHTGEAERVAVH